MKQTQKITVWLLPLIVIGGFWYPMLGYLVAAMMLFLLSVAIFKGRYWCRNLCPRGAFLDGVIAGISRNQPVPKLFTLRKFRWAVFLLLMTFLGVRLRIVGGNVRAIGLVFVVMCAVTTVIAFIIGAATKARGWCMICPMGLLQEKLHSFNHTKKT